MERYTRRLTYSEIKYGYLRIEKEYCNQCPDINEGIIIRSSLGTLTKKMHSSQIGRIDGLTKLYKNNGIRLGSLALITFESKNEIEISFSEGKNLFEMEIAETTNTPLISIIEKIRELITCHTHLFCNNEANVRIELVEPILKRLGWNLQNMNREVKCQNSRRRVDYALYNKEGLCVLVIEAKSLDKPLLARALDKDEIQINNYMKDKRFKSAKYGILTNGQVWQIRDRDGQKIIKSIDILGSEKENENLDHSICEFFEKLNANKFDLSVNITPEEPPHQTANDRHCHFTITQNGIIIPGKKTTERFRNFIEFEDNALKIKKLQENNRLKVTIITQNPEQVRNSKPIKGTNYYSTGDHSTYLKKMLIQQIIQETGIDATIKDINE